MITRPDPSEYAPYYEKYLSQVPELDLANILQQQPAALADLVAPLSFDQEQFRYAVGKWSVRELIGHIIDCERIFGFRMHAISRCESAPIPGFDEDDYIRYSTYHARPLSDLIAEFTSLRDSNCRMLFAMSTEVLQRTGIANGNPISVRALAYILAGHVIHHQSVLSDRYLLQLGV